MQIKTTFLGVIACAAFAHGRAVANAPTSSSRCPNAVTLHTETIGSSGIQMNHFACSNGTTESVPDLRTLASGAPGSQLQSRAVSPVTPRQFQNCQGGAADTECQCATLCGAIPFCFAGPAPAQSDCNVISNDLSETAGSFFVPTGEGTSFTFQSCEAVFINEATSTLEYCFENMASLTSATGVNCMELEGGGVGGCISDNFLWFFELLITGNPIDIP